MIRNHQELAVHQKAFEQATVHPSLYAKYEQAGDVLCQLQAVSCLLETLDSNALHRDRTDRRVPHRAGAA